MKKTEFYSSDPMDYVRVALAIETLAYHNKNYLSGNLQDNAKISEEIQALLIEAVEPHNKETYDKNEECEHEWKEFCIIDEGGFKCREECRCSKCGALKEGAEWKRLI